MMNEHFELAESVFADYLRLCFMSDKCEAVKLILIFVKRTVR